MRSESFVGLCIAEVDGNESLAFQVVNDEVIELSFIIGGIGDKDGALFKAIKTFEFFDEFTGNLCVSGVIWESNGDERNAFFRNDDMGAITPEENEVFFSAVNGLIGIV